MSRMDGKPNIVIFLGPEGLAIRHYEGSSIVVELRDETVEPSEWRVQVVADNTVTVLKSGVLKLSGS